MAHGVLFLPRSPVTVQHMKQWAFRASKLTAGQCNEGEKLIDYMAQIERDNRRG